MGERRSGGPVSHRFPPIYLSKDLDDNDDENDDERMMYYMAKGPCGS
jgi:hypothetical protein